MTDLHDELTAVLDKEVAILERGDFDELDALIAGKERLIDQVLGQNVSVDQTLHQHRRQYHMCPELRGLGFC